VGNEVEAFVRPEAVALARDAADLGPDLQRFSGRVASLLFDGANSAVLVREATTRAEIRIALPQTGRFSDLAVDEEVAFGFDPVRAVCFGAGPRG
jgi:spermidine/putrescine transport system ATP-binding protein